MYGCQVNEDHYFGAVRYSVLSRRHLSKNCGVALLGEWMPSFVSVSHFTNDLSLPLTLSCHS